MTDKDGGEAAASGLVAFIVAGFVFVGSVAAVLYTSDQVDGPAIDDGQATASLQAEAGSIADLLLESAGLTSTTGCGGVQGALCDWDESTAAADHIVRLGLGDPEEPGFLDFTKFQNLRLAPLAASSTDGKVNYNEAVSAMGLSQSGLDFHVRSYPNLQSIQDILDCNPPTLCRDPNMRVTYIGDIDEVHGNVDPTDIAFSSIECDTSATDASTPGNTYRITVTATMPTGIDDVQLEGVFDAKLETGASVSRKSNSFVVSAGEAVTFYGDYAATGSRTCVNAPVEFTLYDTATGEIAKKTQTLAEPGGADTTTDGVVIDTLDESFAPTDAVGFSYDGEGMDDGDPLFLTVCPGDAEVPCDTPTVCNQTDNDAPYEFTCGPAPFSLQFPAARGTGNDPRQLTIGALAAGEYTARLYLGTSASSTAARANERVLVTSTPPGPYVPPTGGSGTATYEEGPAVEPEIGFLEELVDKFCPAYFDAASAADSPLPAVDWYIDDTAESRDTLDDRCAFKGSFSEKGDVFSQARNTLKDDLRARLLDLTADPQGDTPRYDVTTVLIVGSDVDHQVLTSNHVKETIATWVEGGGTLIVFGSADQRLEWLQSVFFIATSETSSNGIAVPDNSHPILHTADDLDYTEYDHNGQTWSFKQNGANADIEGFFTHVVVGTNGDPVLTISDPGAFNEGTVILTTWQAYDLYGDGTTPPAEGLALVNNMLMQGYRDLFLDYGPVIPETDHDVIPAVRKAQVCHPRFDADPDDDVCDMPIPLDVIVYVF